jgi:propanediol dehydratase small subunit
MKDRRINGQALESIMRDVLQGMQDLTCDVSASSVAGEMTVLSVEKPACQQTPVARIIPFPTRGSRGK